MGESALGEDGGANQSKKVEGQRGAKDHSAEACLMLKEGTDCAQASGEDRSTEEAADGRSPKDHSAEPGLQEAGAAILEPLVDRKNSMHRPGNSRTLGKGNHLTTDKCGMVQAQGVNMTTLGVTHPTGKGKVLHDPHPILYPALQVQRNGDERGEGPREGYESPRGNRQH